MKKLNEIIEMERILSQSNEFIVLDIETSGLSPNKGGRIIEIGAVKLINGNIVEEFEQLLYPEMKIYQKTTDLTGITNEMLLNQPVFREVLPKFHKFISNSTIVAHNANFDWERFLKHYFNQVGIRPKNQVIDTLAIAKNNYPNLQSYKLGELCKYFNIDLENAHRAIHDARATSQLLIKLKNNIRTQSSQEQINLFALEPQIDIASNYEVENNDLDVKIKNISHWKKQVSKTKFYERIYVSLNIGNIYFDIPTRTWGVQNSNMEIDLKSLSEKIVKELKTEKQKHYKAIESIKSTTIQIEDMLIN